MTSRRPIAFALLAGNLIALAVACGEDVVVVSAHLAPAQRGFGCRDDDGTPLVQRVLDSGAACVIADFIEYEETPSCRFAELRDACCDDRCDALRARKQMPLDVGALLDACAGGTGGAFDFDCAAAFVATTLRELSWLDAPQGLVSLRVTVTNDSCEARTEEPADAEVIGDYEPFAPETLVGCVFSCPANLALQTSELVLDLDVVDPRCEPVVAACANLRGPHCGR